VGGLEHGGGVVEADDVNAGAGEGQSDAAGSAAEFEDRAAGAEGEAVIPRDVLDKPGELAVVAGGAAIG